MNMDPTVAFVIVLRSCSWHYRSTDRATIMALATDRWQRASRSDKCTRGYRRNIHRFHIAAIVALSAGMIVLFVAAAIGAVLVLWGWREFRLWPAKLPGRGAIQSMGRPSGHRRGLHGRPQAATKRTIESADAGHDRRDGKAAAASARQRARPRLAQAANP